MTGQAKQPSPIQKSHLQISCSSSSMPTRQCCSYRQHKVVVNRPDNWFLSHILPSIAAAHTQGCYATAPPAGVCLFDTRRTKQSSAAGRSGPYAGAQAAGDGRIARGRDALQRLRLRHAVVEHLGLQPDPKPHFTWLLHHEGFMRIHSLPHRPHKHVGGAARAPAPATSRSS